MKGSMLTINMENFKITDEGKVTVKGAIEAKEGYIANWIIGTDMLYSGEGATHVELSSAED
jgi:acyl CoA:acetate/3-ketoacid CoA transferase beta subunit